MSEEKKTGSFVLMCITNRHANQLVSKKPSEESNKRIFHAKYTITLNLRRDFWVQSIFHFKHCFKDLNSPSRRFSSENGRNAVHHENRTILSGKITRVHHWYFSGHYFTHYYRIGCFDALHHSEPKTCSTVGGPSICGQCLWIGRCIESSSKSIQCSWLQAIGFILSRSMLELF